MALIEIDGLPNLIFIAWWIFPWQTVSHNQMVICSMDFYGIPIWEKHGNLIGMFPLAKQFREHQVNEHVALECKKMVPISQWEIAYNQSGPLTEPTWNDGTWTNNRRGNSTDWIGILLQPTLEFYAAMWTGWAKSRVLSCLPFDIGGA
jgi:hypothetical protein